MLVENIMEAEVQLSRLISGIISLRSGFVHQSVTVQAL
jgi:hypothetical protein